MRDLLLVCRNHIFRETLATIIALRVPGCVVRVQTSSWAQALSLLSRNVPIDGAIVDLVGQIEEPIDLVRALGQHRPGLAVLVLTDSTTMHLTQQLHEAGAMLVFDNSDALAGILEGIQHLCSRVPAEETCREAH